MANTKEYKSITTNIGVLFTYVVTIIFTSFFGFLIYSILTKKLVATIILAIFIIILFFVFILPFYRSRKLLYNNEEILVDQKIISLNCIEKVKYNHIVLKEVEVKRKVYFIHYFSYLRILELMGYIENNKK